MVVQMHGERLAGADAGAHGAGARDLQQRLHLVLVLAQPRLRQDDGFLHARRVQPVLVHTAVPRIADRLLMPRRRQRPRTIGGHLHHGGDVLVLRAGVHGATPG